MKATRFYLIVPIAVVLMAAIYTGCVSTDQAVHAAGLQGSEEKQFRKAQTKTRAQGITLGAVVGAGVGYAIGGSWESAIAGAVTGGTAGGVVGEKKAKVQGKIMVTERDLDSMIAATKSKNASLRSQVSRISSQRAAYQQKIAAAKKKNDAGALASIRKEMKSTLGGVDGSLSGASATIKDNNSVSETGAKRDLLRSETAKLNATTKELQKERELFASLYNSIDV
jgi:outer membrane lipoprotein SlyB